MMHTGKVRGRGILAAAAAMVLGGVAAQNASAALVYDLRLTSGGGKAVAALPGETVSVDVFAVVTGANATADEGYTNGFYSILSNSFTTGPALNAVAGGGNLAPFNSGDQDGFLQDIDGDTDIDIGKDAGQAGNGNFIFSRTGTTGGENGAEFKLGTYTFLVAPGGGFGDATLNVAVPGANGTGTTGINAPILYKSDNAPVNNLNLVSVGQPVVVSAVPEPTTLGLLAVAGVGLLARRRRGC